MLVTVGFLERQVSTMDSLQILIVGLPLLLAVILVLYYIVLTRQQDWAVATTDHKIQLCIAPLPIAVGLLAALIGLMATRYAISVTQEEDTAQTLENTGERAATLYANLLVELDRVYTVEFDEEIGVERSCTFAGVLKGLGGIFLLSHGYGISGGHKTNQGSE